MCTMRKSKVKMKEKNSNEKRTHTKTHREREKVRIDWPFLKFTSLNGVNVSALIFILPPALVITSNPML